VHQNHITKKALTGDRTDHFRNILADREFLAGCYLFTIHVCFSAIVPSITGFLFSTSTFNQSTASIAKQEGQHKLAGQRAANFRLLANQ